MSQSNQIDVTIYPADDSEAVIDIDGVNYISFISSPGGRGEGTYGIPALLADDHVKRDGLPVKILYVNPANIAAMEAERKA